MNRPNWLNTNEYPFELKNFKLNEGYNLNYIDEGNGKVILFVHGTPDWSFSYRNIIKELSKYYRCIALDNLGFGLSDKPNKVNYSIESQSKRLEEFVSSLNLDKFSIVCHDFGGPISLLIALNKIENIENIILMNSWAWDLNDDKNFQKTKVLHGIFGKMLYLNYSFSVKFLMPNSYFDKTKLTKEAYKHFLYPFQSKNNRESTYQYAKELLNSGEYVNIIWGNIEKFDKVKFKILWGMNDKYFQTYILDKFASGLPNAQIVKIENCGHFVSEEQSEIVIQEIKEMITNK